MHLCQHQTNMSADEDLAVCSKRQCSNFLSFGEMYFNCLLLLDNIVDTILTFKVARYSFLNNITFSRDVCVKEEFLTSIFPHCLFLSCLFMLM